MKLEGGRPTLSRELSGLEFARWYWLKSELIAFSKDHGIPSGGAKRDLEARIAAWLDGEPLPAAKRSPSVNSLPEEIKPNTVIPEGQRMTRHLRDALKRTIGPEFRFDGHMRDFLARPGNKTVLDVKAEWERTRDVERAIDEQFEYNAFVRAWREANPGASHAQVTRAWAAHRALPADERAT